MALNLDLMCRLCAKEDPACRPIPVFGEEGKKIRIAKKIGLCLPIIITEEDEYPKQICLSCLNKLDTSYELYSGCIGAQKIIKRMLALIKPTERPREKSPIPEQPVNQIANKAASLSRNNPLARVNSTILRYSERNVTEELAEPRSKVRIVSTESLSNNGNEESTNFERQETDDSGDDNDNMDVDFDCATNSNDMEQGSSQQTSKSNHNVIYSANKNTLRSAAQNTFDQLAGNSASKVVQVSESNQNTIKSLLLKGNNQAIQKNSKQTASAQSPKVYVANSVCNQSSLLENILSVPQLKKVQDNSIVQLPKENTVAVPIQEGQKKSGGTNNTNKGHVNLKTVVFTNKAIPVVLTSQGNTINTSEVLTSKGKNVPVSTVVVRAASRPIATSGFNPVRGHSMNCRCSVCYKSKQIQKTATPTNNTPSLIRTSEMGQKSAVTANAPEFLQIGNPLDEDNPSIGVISSVTSMAPSETDKRNYSATPTDDTSSLTGTNVNVSAAMDSASPVPSVATTDTKSTNSDNSDDITVVDPSVGGNVDSTFCKYCQKYFPTHIYIHHRRLHFRSRFFCCVACEKNFQTEAGLESHRCTST